MKVLNPIAEDGCKYQSNCRDLYEFLILSEKVISEEINRWWLTLSHATSTIKSECGKPIPKCKIHNFLEQNSNKSIEARLKEYVSDNWKIKVPESKGI